MNISPAVAIYLDAVTSMVIPLSVFNSFSVLKSTADSAEYRLISTLELQVKQGLIQVKPAKRDDHSPDLYVTY